jgi:hypothetical protein
MVELSAAVYDFDDIPFVSASVVSIDAELSDDTMVTAEAISPSTMSSISNSAYAPMRESPIPEDRSSISFHRESSNSSSNSDGARQTATPEEARTNSQRAVGAGAAGAVLGLLVGGPVLSIVFGFGTVYYSKQEGATGDLARALGEIALVARDKWKEVDSKHHIVDQGREVANEAIHRIQDRRDHRRQRVYKFVAYCWKSTLQFVEQHRLVERGCDQLKVLAENVAGKIQEHHSRVRDCPHNNHHNSERVNTAR